MSFPYRNGWPLSTSCKDCGRWGRVFTASASPRYWTKKMAMSPYFTVHGSILPNIWQSGIYCMRHSWEREFPSFSWNQLVSVLKSQKLFPGSHGMTRMYVGIVHTSAAAELVGWGYGNTRHNRHNQDCHTKRPCIMSNSEDKASKKGKTVGNEFGTSKYRTGPSVRVARVDCFTWCFCCTT